jgi:hypothetical protein
VRSLCGSDGVRATGRAFGVVSIRTMAVAVDLGPTDGVSSSRRFSSNPMWLTAVTAAVIAAASWSWSTVSGSVPLEVAGDESGRILESYAAATPGGVLNVLTSWDAWTWIHPPGDVAFRATLNMVAGTIVDDPTDLVRVNQAAATLLLMSGVAGVVVGLRALSGSAVAVFLGLSIPSASVIYVAHHALSENLAIALVGLGSGLILTGRSTAAGVVVGLAAVVRPEAALVFATLAAVPFAARQYRRAMAFALFATLPAVAHVALTALVGEQSYASVDLFRHRSVFEVAFSGVGPKVYWGMGIWPWLGAAVASAVLAAGVRVRVPMLSAGRLLVGGWVSWTLVFAWMAARGAIPTQIRTYVVLHLFGAVAIAVATHEVLARCRPVTSQIVTAVAAVAVGLAVVASAQTRREWRDVYPSDVAAVNAFLSTRANGGGILTDWMAWREWTAGVYATEPGGEVCNYLLCTSGTNSVPPTEMTAQLTSSEVRRLTQAWQFVDGAPPRLIAMFNDGGYAGWRAWEKAAHPEVLSSFVRPLLVADGDCFRTVPGLPPTRYCPVLTADRYVVLEAG